MSSTQEQRERNEERVAAAQRHSGHVDEDGRPTTSRVIETADGFTVGPIGDISAGVERAAKRKHEIIARNMGARRPAPAPATQPTGGNPPTQPQTDLIRRVLAERQGLPAAEAVRADLNAHRTAGTLSGAVASDAITRLLAIKVARPLQPQQQLPNVPEGHYAIESTGHNDLAFYRVDRPTQGTYAGRVFVKLVVGGKPDANVPWSHVPGILRRIVEAGIDQAHELYGREIGRCWRCNRHLTDQASRDAGIGPECATKAAA